MVAKILGITHYDKDGKRNYTLHFVQEFSEYEMTSGAEGLKVGTVWTQLPEAGKVWVNDLVNLVFEPGFQGKATLVDIIRYTDKKDHPLFTVNAPGVPDPTAETKTETATSAKGSK